VHPKPAAHEVESVPFVHPIYGDKGFRMPGPDYFVLVDDYTFGMKSSFSAEQYHEALEKLDKWFFRRLSGDLSKIRLLRARGNA
jgi:hypothetical protein